MKSFPSFHGCVAILITTSGAFAVESSTQPAPTAPPSSAVNVPASPPGTAGKDEKGNLVKPTKTTALANSTSIAPPHLPGLKFDDYLKDLADALKLSDDEKKEIQACYLADGVLLKNILNNDSLSPLQQARQVSDVRDVRNNKIEALLQDIDRKHTFLKVEARYRVALTEVAANGELVPAPTTPPPAPSTPTSAAPAEKAPATKAEAK
jgi:hypothetical protein